MIGLETLFIDVDGRPAGRAKRVVRAVVAFALAVAPLLIAIAVTHQAAVVRRWPVVACTIVDSGVDSVGTSPEREDPYRPTVSFAFTYHGQSCLGQRMTAGGGATSDAAEAYAQVARYPVGSRATCHVDPANPSESVLAKPAPAWEPFAVPATAAIAVAVTAFYCLPQRRLAWNRPGGAHPVVRPRRRRWVGVLSGGLMFVGFGSAVGYWWIDPLARTVAARRWRSVPCVVEANNVQRHRDYGEVPMTFYRTDVLYRYVVDGRPYHSNRYSLTECQSPSQGGRDRVAAAYPRGSAATCFVDPADPASAVLTRRVSPTAAFGLFPLAFALLGLIAMGVGGRDQRFARAVRSSRWSLAAAGVVALLMMAWAVVATP